MGSAEGDVTRGERGVRVVVADDHPIVRAGLTAVISRAPQHVVVGEARDGEGALRVLEGERPDVCVLDLRMPRLSGFEVVARGRDVSPETVYLVLTMYDDAASFARAMDLEVEGYIHKERAVDEIVVALTALASGQRYVSRASELEVPASPADDATLVRAFDALTPTERVVLRHVAANKTSRQIAAELGVSVRTVQNHRANICEKLELRGANRLLQFALENKLAILAPPAAASSPEGR